MINIPKNKLPTILRKKLEFGNRTQINALKSLANQIDEQNKYVKLQAKGKLKYFEVKLEIKSIHRNKVWAENKAEACKIAETEFCGDADSDDIMNAWADETTPSMTCFCYRRTGMKETDKPLNWDSCPVHGNTAFDK